MTSFSSTRTAPLPISETSRLPFSLTGATLVSFVALWLSENRSILLPFLGVALVTSQLVRIRFDARSREIKALRVVLFGLVILLTIGRLRSEIGDGSPLFLLPIVGAMAACEITVLAWLREMWGGSRCEVGVFLSGLVMAAGGATYETSYLKVLVPLYFCLLVFALNALRSAPFGAAQRKQNKISLPRLMRVILAFFAVGLGASLHRGVMSYASEMNELANRFLEDKPAPQPSGLSTSPQLGSSFGDHDAPERVVTIRNLGDEPHLRAVTFDTYRDGRWLPVAGDRTFERVNSNELHPRAKGRRALVTRYLDDNGLMLTTLDTQGIITPPDSEMEWSRDDRTPLRSLDSLQNYRLILPNSGLEVGDSSTRIADDEKARCLKVPKDIDARVRLIAAHMGSDQNPRERIEAVIQYLQAHHRYSLKTTRGEGDPLNSFLLENKAAHCEYFASAAAILLRCMNVPTRYVIGYYAHESDGDLTTVRLRDAHAWAESWIEGVGWVTVEATPASGIPHENASLSWSQKLRESLQDCLMSARHWLVHFVLQTRLNQAAPLLIGLFCAILAARFWWKKCQSSTRNRFYTKPNAELARLMKRFVSAMKRRGLKCPPQQTWREYLPAQPQTGDAQLFLDLYEEARFGGANSTDALRDLQYKLQSMRS